MNEETMYMANIEELQDMNKHLQDRCVALNAEVRRLMEENKQLKENAEESELDNRERAEAAEMAADDIVSGSVE